MISFTLNQTLVSFDVPPETPLLWVIREEAKLTGTKFGCGMAQCGACTILIDDAPMRSCMTPVSFAAGKRIETIEWHTQKEHPVREAWIKHNVAQCGYCQPGQMMQLIGTLNQKPKFTEDELLDAMSQNICRCGTYNRIKLAMIDAAKAMGKLI